MSEMVLFLIGYFLAIIIILNPVSVDYSAVLDYRHTHTILKLLSLTADWL